MIDTIAKESKMLMEDQNKDADRQQQIIEKAMDVAAQTGASAIKISGDI
jgi:hypothetical protein